MTIRLTLIRDDVETSPEQVIDRLDALGYRPRRHSGYWLSFCPAHDDGQRPSLSVKQGAGTKGASVLVNCHAGCSFEDVMRVLDMGRKAPEVYRTAPIDGPRTIVARYPYCDESGELLFEVVRYDPKDFRQRRPLPNGEWANSLGDVRRVLYRLPEVIAAAKTGQRVYVVEGEKDADALRAAGAIATCAPGGARKWSPDYTAALAGAQVVIVADRDEPDAKTGKIDGDDHALLVARSVASAAASVRLVYPAVGKDSYDHLAAGKGLDEWAPFRSEPAHGLAAHVHVLDLDALLATEPEPPDWLWDGYIERGTLAVLHGDGGLGKSAIGLGLERAMSTGSSWLGKTTKKGHGLYLDGENAEKEIKRRLWGMGYRPGERSLRYARVSMPIMLDVAAAEPYLRELIGQARTDLVILDSQRGLWGGDERESLEVRPFYMMLSRVAETMDVGVLLLHHDNKLGIYSGSTDVNASVASRLHIERKDPKDKKDRRRVVWQPKNRSGPEQEPVTFEIQGTPEGLSIVLHEDDTTPHDATPVRPEATPYDVALYIEDECDGKASPAVLRAHFNLSDHALRDMREALAALHIDYVSKGPASHYRLIRRETP